MHNPFRQLARDSAIYGLSTVIQRLLTFLLTPLYTNILAPSELGDVAQLYSLMALVTVLATLGFEPAFMRYWAERDDRTRVFTHAFAATTVVAAAIVVLGAGGAGIISRGIALSSPRAELLVCMACAIVAFDAVAAIPFALLRMERRALLFALVRVTVVAVNVALNVVFVAYWRWGVEGVLMAGVAASLLSVVLLLPTCVRYFEWRYDGHLLGALLQFGLPTVPAAFAAMVVQVADRPILGWIAGPDAVGIYNANYRLAIPMMLAVSVYETAWRPLYLQHASQHHGHTLLARALRYYLAAAVVLYAVVAAFIGDVVAIPIGKGHLIGAQYWSGLGIVPVVMAGYLVLGITTTVAAGIHITKRTEYLPLTQGAAAGANVVLNLALIPFLGYIGAAWATFGAYVVGAIATVVICQRIYPVRYGWGEVLVALATCGVVAWTLHLLPQQGAIGVKSLCVGGAGIVAGWLYLKAHRSE
ncbi:MAG: lipopolysaccharide biosynthesis protein [Bacteroidota bacterium]|nr:lipopolysaccharide biosynthesis protein [Bacteroidota bacterium]